MTSLRPRSVRSTLLVTAVTAGAVLVGGSPAAASHSQCERVAEATSDSPAPTEVVLIVCRHRPLEPAG